MWTQPTSTWRLSECTRNALSRSHETNYLFTLSTTNLYHGSGRETIMNLISNTNINSLKWSHTYDPGMPAAILLYMLPG